MERKNKIIKNIVSTIFLIILIVILIKVYEIYKSNSFNMFMKAERYVYSSKFIRDNEIKYSDYSSYKIISNEYNDAVFYKKIAVIPNTAYKMTCMIKTENVVSKDEISEAGAQICILETFDKTKTIKGTTDWQQAELLFNSKNNTELEIGFRLGGYEDSCKGTAWFSDFKLELGASDTDNTWKVACFVFENIDTNININGQEKKIKVSMNNTDIQDVKNTLERFTKTAREFSDYNLNMDYDIINIKTPVTTIKFDKETWYYLDPLNVEELIYPYINKTEYDHIFAICRLGNTAGDIYIPTKDWIGLGGMDYLGIGYSVVRMQNEKENYMYQYDERYNTFPEEVFLHEFLHTLERNSREYKLEIPELHDYEKYHYKEDRLASLKEWYRDYMKKNINTVNNEKIGLDKSIYLSKPIHQSNFINSYEIEFIKEPQNILEELNLLFRTLMQIFETTREIEPGELENEIKRI